MNNIDPLLHHNEVHRPKVILPVGLIDVDTAAHTLYLHKIGQLMSLMLEVDLNF
jgi:hypothetical protein